MVKFSLILLSLVFAMLRTEVVYAQSQMQGLLSQSDPGKIRDELREFLFQVKDGAKAKKIASEILTSTKGEKNSEMLERKLIFKAIVSTFSAELTTLNQDLKSICTGGQLVSENNAPWLLFAAEAMLRWGLSLYAINTSERCRIFEKNKNQLLKLKDASVRMAAFANFGKWKEADHYAGFMERSAGFWFYFRKARIEMTKGKLESAMTMLAQAEKAKNAKVPLENVLFAKSQSRSFRHGMEKQKALDVLNVIRRDYPNMPEWDSSLGSIRADIDYDYMVSLYSLKKCNEARAILPRLFAADVTPIAKYSNREIKEAWQELLKPGVCEGNKPASATLKVLAAGKKIGDCSFYVWEAAKFANVQLPVCQVQK